MALLILLLMIPLSSASQLVVPSDVIRNSSDAILLNSSSSYVLLKSISPPANITGYINTAFAYNTIGTCGFPIYTKLLKNGVSLVGTEQSGLHCDINYAWINQTVGVTLNTTDTLELWGWEEAGNSIQLKNYSMMYSNATATSPTNGSVLSKTYPPLTSNIIFNWTYISTFNSNLLIAKDVNFNLITVDATVANNYSTQSLEAGNYWWKFRYYDGTLGTYTDYSDTFNFTLSNAQTISGTNIQGTVYELVNGIITPVSNARVIIRNDVLNWTSEQITGSNGYYLFTGLSNTTSYSIYATKTETFKDSVVYYVNPVDGATSTQNILLERCVSSYDCFYNQGYVKFIVQNFFGTQYSNVAVSVYKGDDIVAEKTDTTGTDGSVSFLLVKDQEYRLTFIKASNDINKEITLVPGDSKEFTVIIWSFAENRDDSVAWNLSSSVATASLTNLNLTYTDSSGLTTLINFWVLNGSNISQIVYSTSASASSLNAGYAVNSTVAGTYVYGFNATRNGVIITGNTVITFAGSSTLIDLKIDSKYYNWISIILLVSISLLFSYKTNRNGYILVPLVAFLLSVVGWFSISYLITSSVLLIGVIAYLRSAEKQSEVGF